MQKGEGFEVETDQGRCLTAADQMVVCAVGRRLIQPPESTAVVEMPADLNTMEQTHAYNGLYYVLMGRLSPLDGVGPRELSFDRLLARAGDGVVREVILATNLTHEGEATAHYLSEMLHARGVKVSRIARGLPLGSELEYSDAASVAQALLERRDY